MLDCGVESSPVDYLLIARICTLSQLRFRVDRAISSSRRPQSTSYYNNNISSDVSII